MKVSEKIYLRLDTYQSAEGDLESGRMSSKVVGGKNKLRKMIETTEAVKKKKQIELKKHNRVKLALELHQQLYTELEAAAVVIQKHVKGYFARKSFKERLIEKYEFENYLLRVDKEIGEFWEGNSSTRHMAAFRIQRYWKGFRKHPKELKLVQRIAKSILAKREITQLAYVKIQRMIKFKRILKNQRKAELKVLKDVVYIWTEACYSDESVDLDEEPPDKHITNEVPTEISEIPVPPIIVNKSFDLQIVPKIEKIPLLPIQPKQFILSEANFAKPTLAFTYKRFETPETLAPKIKKSSTLKSKKLIKQVTARLSQISEKPKELPPPNPSKPRTNSVIKQMHPIPKKYDTIQSKLQILRHQSSLRSSSNVQTRSESNEKLEKSSNLTSDFTEHTLTFKHALPDLYKFVESYGQSSRCTGLIEKPSGLILIKK